VSADASTCAAVLLDERRFVVGRLDGSGRVVCWKAEATDCGKVFLSDDGSRLCVYRPRDGSHFLNPSWVLVVFDTADGTKLSEFDLDGTDALSFCRDGRRLLTRRIRRDEEGGEPPVHEFGILDPVGKTHRVVWTLPANESPAVSGRFCILPRDPDGLRPCLVRDVERAEWVGLFDADDSVDSVSDDGRWVLTGSSGEPGEAVLALRSSQGGRAAAQVRTR
jgi:hypothetical protein